MILLSAFAPFGADEINSSFEVLSAVTSLLDPSSVVLVTLPVSFERCSAVLFEAIERHHPTTVVCFGQAAGRAAITVETTAVNIVGDVADSDGVTRARSPIVLGAPNEFATTLPTELLLVAARGEGVNAQRSNTAGEYVCNFLFYNLQLQLANEKIRSGFVHLPIIEQQCCVHPESAFMELADQVRAVRAMVELVASN